MKYKLVARADKYKLGARVSKHKLGARAGKYRLGARVGAGTGDQCQGRGPSRRPGAGKYKYAAKHYIIIHTF